ncbi:MAG: GWxTD domain-containing protein [Gemmatimonadota bacterium]
MARMNRVRRHHSFTRSTAGLLAIAVTGCGSWSRVGTQPAPDRAESLAQLSDITTIYRRLGRLAVGAPLPFVGSLAFVGGPHDSTLTLVSLSLENRAFAFQKEGREFVAHYVVDVSAQPASGAPVQLSKDETVRVGTFQETLRTDESVLFQQTLRLAPGSHHVTVSVRDRSSATQGHAEGDFMVPAFPSGSLSSALFAYRVRGRAGRDDALSVIVNPRGTVAYGGDTVLAYVEGYQMPGPSAVPFEIRDQDDSLVLRDTLRFTGGREVESEVIRFSPDTAPLGELRLVLGNGAQRKTTSFLVSFSQAWLVTNLEEMVSMLRYFPQSDRLDALRKATPADRSRLWREFWLDTDPDKLTPENEALNRYFARLGVANTRFREDGFEGWRTDRGEVFIGLGEPDEIFDASQTSQGRVIRWTYDNYRVTLYFVDESGFGRYRMTPTSRSDYERVLGRVRRMSS